MCGIFGYSRSKNSVVSNEQMSLILSVLLTHMDERGGDSYGYYYKGDITKGVGTAARGIDVRNLNAGRSLICHTRKATVGTITQQNAHPFRIGNIVGVHNGGVANYEEMNRRYDRKYNVDSQHIFAHYANDLPLYELRAHGAIVFVDEEFSKDVLFACKFNGGSLSIFGIGPHKGDARDVIFASTGNALVSALDLAKVGDYYPYILQEGTLYHISAGSVFIATPPNELHFGVRGYVARNIEREEFTLNPVIARKNTVGYLGGANNRWYDQTPLDSRLLKPGPICGDWSPHGETKTTNLRLVTKNEKPEEVKRFVASRKGLEGYYGSQQCVFCARVKANCKMPTTNLFYCIPCWEHLEWLAAYVLQNVEEMDLFAPFKAEALTVIRPELVEKDDATDEDEADNCELCGLEDAVYYLKHGDTVICDDCRREQGLEITDVALIDRNKKAQLTTPDGERPIVDISMTPVGEPCQFCEQRPGQLHMQSDEHRKLLLVCLRCVDPMIKANEAFIQRGGHQTFYSARKDGTKVMH